MSRHQQLAQVFGALQTLDISLPVGFYIDSDAADPQSSLAYFWQGGLGLPDRDYYSNDAEKSVDIRAKYLLYICLLYTSPSPRDRTRSRMPSSA